MKKPPKFLIAKNEAAQPGAAFVVHTQEPAFIGEIKQFASLLERDDYIEEKLEEDIISITPTTLLVVIKYLESNDRIRNRPFLEKKVAHWLIANFLNSDVTKPRELGS